MGKYKSVLSWTLRVLLFIGFLLASSGKLTSNPKVIEMFGDCGCPNGFYFMIGILELVFGVWLLIPKTLKIEIIRMIVILIGAMVTHIINDPLLELIRPIVFLTLLGGVYFLNFYKKT